MSELRIAGKITHQKDFIEISSHIRLLTANGSHEAKNGLVDQISSFKFFEGFAGSLKIDQDILTVDVLLDWVSQGSLAPFVDLFDLATIFGDCIFDLADERVKGSVFDAGFGKEQSFVRFH